MVLDHAVFDPWSGENLERDVLSAGEDGSERLGVADADDAGEIRNDDIVEEGIELVIETGKRSTGIDGRQVLATRAFATRPEAPARRWFRFRRVARLTSDNVSILLE